MLRDGERENASRERENALREQRPYGIPRQILRPTAGILWRGVALDLEAVYRAKLGKTIVFWGFTSTTSDMAALDAFIPDDSPQRTLFSITTGLAADLAPYSALPGFLAHR